MHGSAEQANTNFALVQYKFSVGFSNKSSLQSAASEEQCPLLFFFQGRRALTYPGKTQGEDKVPISSKCCFSLLLGSVLAVPAFGQQANTSQQSTAGTQVARTMDDLRERILLDRIEQLEKRLADVEGRTASAPPPTGQAAATGAPAAQETALATPPSQAPAATPAPAPAPPTWSEGPIDFSGLVDGYYSFNFNHPASQLNQLYNFDVKANQFSLNMAKLTLAHSPDPVGFQVDLGFGRAFEIIHAGEPSTAPSFLRNIEQAYLSLKPPKAKGFEVDLGQFVTSAGAEVIETNSNWNYSRSLLFAWAIPYYHFGVRASFPVGKYFTGGVQLVNGWNDTEDNNSGKTVGLTGTFTTKKFAWSNNYYGGPENPNTNTGWRHLYDTTLLLTPNGTLNAYINFDYGQNRSGIGVAAFTSKWYGIAGALHVQATPKWSFTPRVEWFKDRDGFSTGLAQDLKEFTLTGEYKMVEGLLARLEYRRDWSNQPFFFRGSALNNTTGFGTYKNQDTLSLGVLAFFGPKR
jgi:hypothetical protein